MSFARSTSGTWSLAAVLAGCRAPTQVTVDVVTDVACADLDGTTIALGAPGNIASAPGAATQACAPASPMGEVGTLVVVPGAAEDAPFALRVVAGVDRPAESCEQAGYEGCIVARREMGFIANTELFLPVALRRACLGKACTERSTCVDGHCVSARVPHPERCAEATACDEQALGGGGPGDGGSGGSGAGGSGAGGSGGGGPSLPCGGPSVLQDDFNGAKISPVWVVNENLDGTVAQNGGRLVVTPPSTGANLPYAEVRSTRAIRLADDEIVVEVPAVAGFDQTYLTLDRRSERLSIGVQGGLIAAALELAGDPPDYVTTSYDATLHRWWRLLESAGQLEWQTGPSSAGPWSTLMGRPTPPFAASAYVSLGAAAADAVPGPPAQFDNFETTLAAHQAWCPVDTLSDGFDDASKGPAWADTVTPNCTSAESGSHVSFALSAPGRCTYETATAFDLTGGTVVLHVETLPPSGAAVVFGVRDDAGARARVIFANGQLAAAVNADAAPLASGPWWRIAAAGADAAFSTSPDGVNWTNAVLLPGLPTGAVQVELGLDDLLVPSTTPLLVGGYNGPP